MDRLGEASRRHRGLRLEDRASLRSVWSWALPVLSNPDSPDACTPSRICIRLMCTSLEELSQPYSG